MPGEERKAFLLRIDPQLWRTLEAWAQDDLRSVNAQIEFLLREAVRRRKQGARPPVGEGPRNADSQPLT